MQILVCIGCSAVASVITTKILATHYFDIVNGYVDGIYNRTKDFVQSTESMISKCQQKDASKRETDEKRLDQALNGKLSAVAIDLSAVLKKYSLDRTPEIAHDACMYALKHHFENVSHNKFEQ